MTEPNKPTGKYSNRCLLREVEISALSAVPLDWMNAAASPALDPFGMSLMMMLPWMFQEYLSPCSHGMPGRRDRLTPRIKW